MRIICEQKELLMALNDIACAVNVVAKKQALIHIEAINGIFRFGYKEKTITVCCEAIGTIDAEGKINVNALRFFNIIKGLPEKTIIISTNENNQMSIECEKIKYLLTAYKSREDIKFRQSNNMITVSKAALKDAIAKTEYAISKENIGWFHGVNMEIDNNKLTLLTSDGHRIAMKSIEVKSQSLNCSEIIKVIVPGKTIRMISAMIADTPGEICIGIFENEIAFYYGKTIVISKLVKSLQPDDLKWIVLHSSDFGTQLYINKCKLKGCMYRIIQFFDGRKRNVNFRVLLRIIGNEMFVKGEVLLDENSIDLYNETIGILKNGKDVTIALNPNYIKDVIETIGDEKIVMSIDSSFGPCFIKNEDQSYTSVILPLLNAKAGENGYKVLEPWD